MKEREMAWLPFNCALETQEPEPEQELELEPEQDESESLCFDTFFILD